MTSALNNQEVVTSHPIEDAQVTTVNDNIQSILAQIEREPLKWIQYLISFAPASTIDLTHSKEEEDRISPVPITFETNNDFQNLTNGSNGNPSSSLPQSQPLCQSSPSSYTILLSSIIDLSSFF